MSSSSQSECDYDSSSSENDTLPLMKKLLDEASEEDSRLNISGALVHTTAIHVPMIVSAMLCKKRAHGGSTSRRRYIHRDRKERHSFIINDYFKGEHSKYTADHFRRRFRMDVNLFMRILEEITKYDSYFTSKCDATGKEGLSPLHKMIAAVRMLAYGCVADLLDEYIQIGESTAIESLKHFCDAVIGVFEKQYLRKPNKDDTLTLLQEAED
ncbi:unnamed protein product [Cuscuta epithymum]|uniref:Uncharacterized protein n=1 Tax=Cuscuta epithymum TaxID=186058 RepID=A0AAV0DK64_9ASTE|nr:unnamed protein product [Cuscuta epithymum]